MNAQEAYSRIESLLSRHGTMHGSTFTTLLERWVADFDAMPAEEARAFRQRLADQRAEAVRRQAEASHVRRSAAAVERWRKRREQP